MSLELTIADVAKPLHRASGFSASWRLGGRGTFSFSTVSLNGSYQPEVGQDCKLFLTGVAVWAGNIQRIKTTALYGDSDAGTPSISACEAVTYERRLDKRIVRLAVYLNQTCKQIITDVINVQLALGSPAVTELAGDLTNVQDGVTLDKYVIDCARVSDILDDLAARSGYCWWVDVNQDLYFVPRVASPALRPAPFSITDATPNCRSLSAEYSLDGFRNQQYIRVSFAAFAAADEQFVGDGATVSWTLAGKVNYVESVSVIHGSPASEEAKTFGVHGVDCDAVTHIGDRDFYYSPGETTIWQDGAATPLTADQILRVQYRILGADVMQVYDGTSLSQRAVIEGGTGATDHLIDDSGEADAVGELAKAQAVLDAKKVLPVEVSGETDEAGLRPGQLLTVAVTVPSVSATVLVDTVEATPRGDGALRYTFHGSTAAYDDWVAVWNRALAAGGGGISGSGGAIAGGTGGSVTIGTGLATIEEWTLTVATTEITTSALATTGALLKIKITQDAVGGRAITWSAAFASGMPVGIADLANEVTLFSFVCGSDAKWWLDSQAALGVQA